MDVVSAHAVQRRGSGEHVMVFGHGLGGTQEQWEPIAAHYARTATVITFDLSGSGRARPEAFSPARHASIVGFADDLVNLCAALDVRGAAYVGHSMSGMAGALAAAGDPTLFTRLVMIGASARYIDDPVDGYSGGFSQQAVDEMLATMATDFDLWAAGFAPVAMGNAERPEFASEFARTLADYQPQVALTAFRAAFTSDFRPVIPRVPVPTLVLQTTNDVAVPLTAAQWLAGAISGARLDVLPVEGHFPHVVAPDEVIRAIDEFMAE